MLKSIFIRFLTSKQARKVPVMHVENSLTFQATFSWLMIN